MYVLEDHHRRGTAGTEPRTSSASTTKGLYHYYGTTKSPSSSASAAVLTPHTCALCWKPIKGGQKFLTLSIDDGIDEPSKPPPPAEPSSKVKRQSGVPARLKVDSIVTRRILGRRRTRMPTTVTCHLKCLNCIECGLPLSCPPPPLPQKEAPPSNDDRALLFDKGGAAAAYKKNVGTSDGRATGGGNAPVFGSGVMSSEEGRERWVAEIFKNFVAHAKCSQHVCAVCGEVISPGEQQIMLPRSTRCGHSNSNDVGGGPYSPQVNSTANNSDNSRPLQSKLCSSSTADRKKMVYQHMRCTRCATCGLPLSTHSSSSESRSALDTTFAPKKDQSVRILLDDSGRPHHTSCMACCCCRKPLFGGYEVHSFFGYQNICQQALGEDPPLLPLPEGRAAALFGSVKSRKAAQRPQNNSRSTSRSTESSSSHELQELVTPSFGGLCCAWCQGRVPSCVSCERRCTVYTDANGRQFFPRALTSKAQRAADLAAAISLGKVVPPPRLTEADGTGAVAGPSATLSYKTHLQRGSAGGALSMTRLPTIGGRDSITANGFTERGKATASSVTGLSKRQSSHMLKTAETQGVLCGQCASLSLVETEAHLKSCVDWVVQFFGEEGIVFTPEMIHLQHLMEKVSKDSAKDGISKGRTSSMQTGSGSDAPSFVEGHKLSGRRAENGLVGTFAASAKLRSKRLTAKEPRPLQQVEVAGLRVDLVSFDALNNGLPQRSVFLSTSTRYERCRLPAARVMCGGESTMSSPFRRGFSASNCLARPIARPLDPFLIRKQLSEGASSNVAAVVPISSKTQTSFFNHDTKQHIHSTSSLAVVVGRKSSQYTARGPSYLKPDKCKSQSHHHTFDSAVGGGKGGGEHLRLLFGRCHVVEVSLVVAPDAALQFDKQLKAFERGNRQTVGVRSGSRNMKSTVGRGATTVTSEARSDCALQRLQTPVNQNTFETAAAFAASVEEEKDQLSRSRSSDIQREGSGTGTTKNVAVRAGALLMKGSFAGGLVKTASGLHAQGLCVRLVKRLVVVGTLPRIMVLQHLAHEFIHAFLACKQKVIDDLPAEEGACNVAAAAVLLRAGAGLLEELIGNSHAGRAKSFSCHDGQRTPLPRHSDVSFELLLVRYRLWKMIGSTDSVYGAGYRRSLETVGVGQLTFGAFVSRLLKTPHK